MNMEKSHHFICFPLYDLAANITSSAVSLTFPADTTPPPLFFHLSALCLISFPHLQSQLCLFGGERKLLEPATDERTLQLSQTPAGG